MNVVVKSAGVSITASTRTRTHGPRVGGSLLIQQETLQSTPEQMKLGCEAARAAIDRLYREYGEELAKIDR